jgi:hypothetical protein
MHTGGRENWTAPYDSEFACTLRRMVETSTSRAEVPSSLSPQSGLSHESRSGRVRCFDFELKSVLVVQPRASLGVR